MGREPDPAILWLEKPSTLLHAIAVARVVGTIAVPLCLFRFVYRFVKKPATSIMDHHLNPWSSVPSERPYVLECDRDSVAEYNAKYDKCRAEKYRLRTDVLPEPFIGRVEAPVVLLNLNPGFSDEDVVKHARPESSFASQQLKDHAVSATLAHNPHFQRSRRRLIPHSPKSPQNLPRKS